MDHWIRLERNKRHLSQAKLSRLADIPQCHLSQYELQKEVPSQVHENLILEAFSKFDEWVKTGEHLHFLRKTRWSDDYKSSRSMSYTRKGVSLREVERYAYSIAHTDASSPRFSEDRERTLSIRGISLFSGCGGLTLGFYQAGTKIIGHVEIEKSARSVFEYNFPNSVDLGHDIRQIDENQLRMWKERFPEIDIVFGGPPCQGFSLTGKRDVYDPRNQAYKDFARVVDTIRPKVFLLENIRLLTSMKTPQGSLLLNDLIRTFEYIGYSVAHTQLNAFNYGVPQSRERFFLMGLDCQKYSTGQIKFPEPTHLQINQPQLSFSDQRTNPPFTLRDAIGDLEYLESGQSSRIDPLHFAVSHPSHIIEFLRDVPEGCSAHDNPDPALRPKSGYNTTYKRMRWDEPASTVSTTFGMISGCRNVHPVATRSLTIREALRCQSFPDDFVVFGSLGEVRTMIGNAVPPQLAYVIADHVIKNYLSSESSSFVPYVR